MITVDNLETFSNIRMHLKYLYPMLFHDESVYRPPQFLLVEVYKQQINNKQQVLTTNLQLAQPTYLLLHMQ